MTTPQDRFRRTRAALDELEEDGVLSPEQRAQVRSRLEAALAARTDRSGLLIRIATTMGALLMGAGLLYWVGMNWDGYGRGLRLALVFGILGAFHGAGYVFAERPGRYPRLGVAFTTAGVLVFGAALALVAQVFHLSSPYPNVVLFWWLLSVPFVLLTRSRAVTACVIVLALIWGHASAEVWFFQQALRGSLTLQGHALLAAAFGAALLGLSALARDTRFDRLEGLLRWGWLPVCLGTWVASFDLGASPTDGGGAALWAPVGVAFLAATAACVGVLVRAQRAGSSAGAPVGLESWRPALALGAGLLLAGAVAAHPSAAYLVANLVLFGGALGLVMLGIRVGSGFELHLGLLVFLAALLSRYFEYLWDKVGATWVFLGAGALLLSVGYVLERRRRDLLARIRKRHA